MLVDLTSLLGLDRIDINTAVQQSLISNEPAIILFNDEQLDDGIRSDNKSLGRYKRFEYKGRFEPIDLKLKGNFRNAENIQIVHDEDSFELTDNDFKTPFLTKRFGKEILGLTGNNISKTANLILDDVINNLETQLS